jgi:glutathione S-transferase
VKLYTSIGPNPRVVRIFLAEKGVDVPLETVDLMGGENRKAPYLEKNPAGQLPCLELDDGSFLSEVLAICEYLEEKRSTPSPC